MKGYYCEGKTPLDYARELCDTMMETYQAKDLPPAGRFHYHQGVFLSGMEKTLELSGDEKYGRYINAWVDSLVDENGVIRGFHRDELDDVQPGILLYRMYRESGDERYARAIESLMDVVRHFPKNQEGGFWHKGSSRDQMWLDGLYMAGPFCALYGKTFHDPQCFDLCVFQASLMEEKTKDETTGLWYHAWDSLGTMPWADPETGRSPEFWGRSVGWVPVALLDELECMPEESGGYKKLANMAVGLLKAAERYQDESGLWYQVLDKGGEPENWLETSCTCLFAAAISKAVRLGLLESSHMEAAKRAFEGVVKRLKRQDGKLIVDQVCVGTGVGDYLHYCRRPTCANDLHGAGAFLLMCTEVHRALWESFPDGRTIDPWFYEGEEPKLSQLGTQYVLTQYHILDDGKVHTKEIQGLIDQAAASGGGVIVVPAGTYLTGALFFKQGVNLYVAQGGTLKGSDEIGDYPIMKTRIEGETCLYFPGLINADGLDGFTLCGPGTVDGNGLRSWKAFWQRRAWNPDCTNKDEQRARLVYLSNCTNVVIAGLCLQNAQFWTTHIYRCSRVRYLNCRIFSPANPVKAPSTDAIDIDVCQDVLIRGCYMEVNDDSVVLKGGKGTWADQAPENGSNERILVEDCVYGFCHGCLTCGSESVHNRNIIVRRIQVLAGSNLLWLKMRPDTPQHYEYIRVEEIKGRVERILQVRPWTQFYEKGERTDMPVSRADHVTLKNCQCECGTYFDVVKQEDQYCLSDFTLENLRIKAEVNGYSPDLIHGVNVKNVTVEQA